MISFVPCELPRAGAERGLPNPLFDPTGRVVGMASSITKYFSVSDAFGGRKSAAVGGFDAIK
jgi:hypothetical protein